MIATERGNQGRQPKIPRSVPGYWTTAELLDYRRAHAGELQQVADRVQDVRRASCGKRFPAASTGGNRRDQTSPGPQPGLDVACGIADHRKLAYRAATQPDFCVSSTLFSGLVRKRMKS